MGEAAGIIEVYGLTTAFAAADAGCKAADVTIENFDKNKPGNAEELPVPLIVLIKFRGGISDVKAALAAARQTAESLAGVVTVTEIAAPESGTEKILSLSGMDK